MLISTLDRYIEYILLYTKNYHLPFKKHIRLLDYFVRARSERKYTTPCIAYPFVSHSRTKSPNKKEPERPMTAIAVKPSFSWGHADALKRLKFIDMPNITACVYGQIYV